MVRAMRIEGLCYTCYIFSGELGIEKKQCLCGETQTLCFQRCVCSEPTATNESDPSHYGKSNPSSSATAHTKCCKTASLRVGQLIAAFQSSHQSTPFDLLGTAISSPQRPFCKYLQKGRCGEEI